jgi:hypothetical protein
VLSHIGWAIVHQGKYAEAETILDDAYMTSCLRRPHQPEGEIRFNWAGLLGASLVAQKKYPAAEDRLLVSYKARTQQVMAGEGNLFTAHEAVEWLVRLYDEWRKPEGSEVAGEAWTRYRRCRTEALEHREKRRASRSGFRNPTVKLPTVLF